MSNSDHIGVLLMAYGSPERPEDIEPYYTHIRHGRAPTPELLHELKARYARIADKPNLNALTRAQAAGVQTALDEAEPGRFKIYVGMKHWHPYIAATVEQMIADGLREAVALVLAPHYSRMSVETYLEAATTAADGRLTIHPIKHWHDEPLFLDLWAARVRDTLDRFDPKDRASVDVIFSAHSLPERILTWDDPYPKQLTRSAADIAERAGLSHWHFAYQSAGRTPVPWLGPDILEYLRELHAKGSRRVMICPIGFVAEHLEVYNDIDYEAAALAHELGIQLERPPMPNADPAFVGLIAQLIVRRAGDA